MELKAMKLVSSYLGIEVEHTGTNSKKPDLLVHSETERYEIDVTLAVDEWRMKQHGSLFKNGSFELCEIPGMPISLIVLLGQQTSIKRLCNSAIQVAELVLDSGVEQVFSVDYYMMNGNFETWGITEAHQNLFKICQALKLESLQRVPGHGQLIRIATGFGGCWSGGVEVFNEWLDNYLQSKKIQQKIERSCRLSSGPLGLFVWLNSAANYGAHEWLDRGQGVPTKIDLAELGIKELWVASPHATNSFVHLSPHGWHASHNGTNLEPWFSRHYGSETQIE